MITYKVLLGHFPCTLLRVEREDAWPLAVFSSSYQQWPERHCSPQESRVLFESASGKWKPTLVWGSWVQFVDTFASRNFFPPGLGLRRQVGWILWTVMSQ